MISLDLLRANPEAYKQAAINKNRVVEIDKILELDTKVRELHGQEQMLRAERNILAELGKTSPEQARAKGKESSKTSLRHSKMN